MKLSASGVYSGAFFHTFLHVLYFLGWRDVKLHWAAMEEDVTKTLYQQRGKNKA